MSAPDLSSGTSTTITLDPAFTGALAAAGVTLTADGDASLSRQLLTLPITGGHLEAYDKLAVSPYVQGRVEHRQAALSLRRSGRQVRLGDPVLRPGWSLITGTALISGATTTTDLFRLDGSTLQPLRNEQGSAVLDGIRVSLHPAGASLLRKGLDLSTDQLPDDAFVGVAKLVLASVT